MAMTHGEQLAHQYRGMTDGKLNACIDLLEVILPHMIADQSENVELLHDVKEVLERIQGRIDEADQTIPALTSTSGNEALEENMYLRGKRSAEFNFLGSLTGHLNLVLSQEGEQEILRKVLPESVIVRESHNLDLP